MRFMILLCIVFMFISFLIYFVCIVLIKYRVRVSRGVIESTFMLLAVAKK